MIKGLNLNIFILKFEVYHTILGRYERNEEGDSDYSVLLSSTSFKVL